MPYFRHYATGYYLWEKGQLLFANLQIPELPWFHQLDEVAQKYARIIYSVPTANLCSDLVSRPMSGTVLTALMWDKLGK